MLCGDDIKQIYWPDHLCIFSYDSHLRYVTLKYGCSFLKPSFFQRPDIVAIRGYSPLDDLLWQATLCSDLVILCQVIDIKLGASSFIPRSVNVPNVAL